MEQNVELYLQLTGDDSEYGTNPEFGVIKLTFRFLTMDHRPQI